MTYTLFSASDRFGAVIVHDRCIGYDVRVHEAVKRLQLSYGWSYASDDARCFGVGDIIELQRPWVEVCYDGTIKLFGKVTTDETRVFNTLVEWAQIVLDKAQT